MEGLLALGADGKSWGVGKGLLMNGGVRHAESFLSSRKSSCVTGPSVFATWSPSALGPHYLQKMPSQRSSSNYFPGLEGHPSPWGRESIYNDDLSEVNSLREVQWLEP